jgi:hypothetical protein
LSLTGSSFSLHSHVPSGTSQVCTDWYIITREENR